MSEEFYTFIKEREAIRLRKEAGLPFPWTQDPILSRYKFTNVHREHDRTSRALITNFYEPHADAPFPEILFNTAVFRYFGTSEFAQALGWQRPTEGAITNIKLTAYERQTRGDRVFTGAYIVTNAGRPGNKITVVCGFLENFRIKLDKIQETIRRLRTMKDAINIVKTVDGFSTFMAKEVLLDTLYTNAWISTDAETWTPIGPGARRGAARVKYGELLFLSEKEALEVCLFLYSQRKDYWPAHYKPLTLDCIQFQLCEFDKYKRVQLNQGRPRSIYRPDQ